MSESFDQSRGAECGAVAPTSRALRHVAIDLVQAIEESVGHGTADLAGLPEIDECVFIKNGRGVVVYANAAHRGFFTPEESPIGRTGHAFLDSSIIPAAEKLDELILHGCPYAETEHYGCGPDGRRYRLRTHKRSLAPLGAPGLAILGVTRVLSADQDESGSPRMSLAQHAERFRALSERDQEVCRKTALGASSRQLGEEMGLTTRGVELRKQKAFARLGVAKAVDLARLLTRLQDGGYVDLGL